MTGRTGGVYIPPFKLAMMQKEMEAKKDTAGAEFQRMTWEALRKSINGLINKVSPAPQPVDHALLRSVCILERSYLICSLSAGSCRGLTHCGVPFTGERGEHRHDHPRALPGELGARKGSFCASCDEGADGVARLHAYLRCVSPF